MTRPEDSPRTPVVQRNVEVATFAVDGQAYGVPVAAIQEVVAGQQLRSVPLMDQEVAGLLDLRGQPILVIDGRARMGLAPFPSVETATHLVLRGANETCSLLVDHVGDVMLLDPSEANPTPRNLDIGLRPFANSIHRLEDSLIVMLDVEKVLEPWQPETTSFRREEIAK